MDENWGSQHFENVNVGNFVKCTEQAKHFIHLYLIERNATLPKLFGFLPPPPRFICNCIWFRYIDFIYLILFDSKLLGAYLFVFECMQNFYICIWYIYIYILIEKLYLNPTMAPNDSKLNLKSDMKNTLHNYAAHETVSSKFSSISRYTTYCFWAHFTIFPLTSILKFPIAIKFLANGQIQQ